MLKIGSNVIHANDVPRAAEFWAKAIGYQPREGADEGWAMLTPADGIGPNLAFDRSDRTHLDLYSDDQEADVERLIGMGAERVEDWPYPADADFVVLRDPVGNLFCVVDAAQG